MSSPDITIDKTVNRTIASSDDFLTYTISFMNVGNAAADTVYINDTLPMEVTYISSDVPPDSIVGNDLAWVFNNITPSSTITIHVTVLL